MIFFSKKFPKTHDFHVLIVEPNRELAIPYMYLPIFFKITCVPSIQKAIEILHKTPPNLVFLSASFSATKSLQFLETLKRISAETIIPLIFVVDWSQRITRVLGTTWGGRIGLSHSLASADELHALLSRIFDE